MGETKAPSGPKSGRTRSSRNRRTAWMAGALFLVVLLAVGVTLAARSDRVRSVVPRATWKAGAVSVEPESAVSGETGTWTVRVGAGSRGISKGGSILVQFPPSWHKREAMIPDLMQFDDPKADSYVTASASRPGVTLTVSSTPTWKTFQEKNAQGGLDGMWGRYVVIVRVQVASGKLEPEDTIGVVYGDRSGGSVGTYAPLISRPKEPIRIAIDSDGNGTYETVPSPPMIETRPGAPDEAWMVGPSSAVVGEAAELRLSVVDKMANQVSSFHGVVKLRVLAGEADLPETVALALDSGHARIPFAPKSAGILRIEAQISGDLNTTVRVNPARVEAEAPARRLYWGDLHSHTIASWDGIGTGSFAYARDVASLDFFARTDHSTRAVDGRSPLARKTAAPMKFDQGLNESMAPAYQHESDSFNRPNEFITINAYEISFGSPAGHHNVYFRHELGPLATVKGVGDLPSLWKLLQAGDALTIPHHTAAFPVPILWEPQDPALRRNIEIYSAHGLSESFDKNHPLGFENNGVLPKDERNTQNGQTVQDAWMHGLMLSTIASSDDHRAQPGKPQMGLAAISAEHLTRDSVFQALYDRHTYGTTGDRILLDFSVNDAPMGQSLVAPTGPLAIHVEAHASEPIEQVDVLRRLASDDHFEVIKTLTPDAVDVDFREAFPAVTEDAIYYVRLRRSGEIRKRIVMAWSSPIWVQAKAPPP